MAKLVEGKVALITGAAGGIGREHALMLASHGAKIVVNDLGGDMSGQGEDLTPNPEGRGGNSGYGGRSRGQWWQCCQLYRCQSND